MNANPSRPQLGCETSVVAKMLLNGFAPIVATVASTQLSLDGGAVEQPETPVIPSVYRLSVAPQGKPSNTVA